MGVLKNDFNMFFVHLFSLFWSLVFSVLKGSSSGCVMVRLTINIWPPTFQVLSRVLYLLNLIVTGYACYNKI